MSHALAFALGVGTGVGVLIALSLWADERNQRFYQSSEVRSWHG